MRPLWQKKFEVKCMCGFNFMQKRYGIKYGRKMEPHEIIIKCCTFLQKYIRLMPQNKM